jgi:small subunit ribosomal protein S5
MGYIQYGRNIGKILRFTSVSNVVRNSVRSQLGCESTALPSCSHFHGKNLYSTTSDARIVQDLIAQVERDRHRERNERIRAGLDTADIDAENEEDYMGISSVIEKLEKEKLKETTELNRYEEPTDSDSDEEDVDASQKKFEDFEKKYKRHEEMIQNFIDADTLDDAFKWMQKVDKFEERHFKLPTEYRVIGELMNRLKVVTEQKDRFILQHKLNRALRLVRRKEAYDPDNPANYGVIQHEQVGPNVDTLQQSGFEKEDKPAQGDEDAAAADNNDDEEEFDDMKEKDNIILAKLDVIDKKLEEKLAELEYTFGRKGKALEEEIRDLAEERNELTETKRRPLFRKVVSHLLDYRIAC